MSKESVIAAAVALLCLAGVAQAITVDTVSVGDPGNSPDSRYYTPGYGSVGYTFNIGKYEITAGQYCAFLNAKASTSDDHGLYNPWMADPLNALGCNILRDGSPGSYAYSVAGDWANRPVNYVSILDAFRFANWLHNGQGSGDTESGAYDMSSGSIQRSSGWNWAVAGRDEWHKAAFYRGGGTDAGYWDYATQSDIAPSNDLAPTDSGNNANYYGSDYTVGSPYYRTTVGEFESSESAYGTFDQNGNVWEMNDSKADQSPYSTMGYFGLRGGGFSADLGEGTDMSYVLRASHMTYINPDGEFYNAGFRVVQAVPEPSSFIALTGGLASLLAMRRRR